MSRLQLAAIGCVIGALVIAIDQDRQESDIQRKHYCEMFKIYKQSGGEYGWPAFNGESECNQ